MRLLTILFFSSHNSSGRIKALGFTQPLTGIKSKKIMFLRSKPRPVRRADNLTAICEPIAYTM
jgi:hypothetical protein